MDRTRLGTREQTCNCDMLQTRIKTLLSSEDPRKEGHMLHGPWEGCYSYEIGLKYRLIYRVKFERKEIEFLAVGTHKIY